MKIKIPQKRQKSPASKTKVDKKKKVKAGLPELELKLRSFYTHVGEALPDAKLAQIARFYTSKASIADLNARLHAKYSCTLDTYTNAPDKSKKRSGPTFLILEDTPEPVGKKIKLDKPIQEDDRKTKHFYAQHEISVYGGSADGMTSYTCPPPVMSFEHSPFPGPVNKAIEQAGYTDPTPIQAVSWPVIMQGRDVVSVAKTGSGKTCAFLLPALVHILAKRAAGVGRKAKPSDGPLALILCPTRELAQQIHGECELFGSAVDVSSVCLFGGTMKWEQAHQLEQERQLVVATPGRMLDVLKLTKYEEPILRLGRVDMVVLDEADRMLGGYSVVYYKY
jgi:ATP-dependent helicase YprA (DUF1998 family)